MLPEPTPAWARSTISSARFGFSHRFRRPVHLLEPGVFRLWDVTEGVVDAGGLLAAGRQRETLRLDTARGEVFGGRNNRFAICSPCQCVVYASKSTRSLSSTPRPFAMRMRVLSLGLPVPFSISRSRVRFMPSIVANCCWESPAAFRRRTISSPMFLFAVSSSIG